MANVAVGQEAPDFTLRNESNQPVTLSSLRGAPVVLFFYPLDFSPICTNEACAYRDDFSDFAAKGTQVFGISRDSTWTHKAFKEQNHLNYTLLADMDGAVAKLYGCWNDAIGIAERLTAVIDKDGKIVFVQHNSPIQPRDQKEALAAIA